LIDHAIYFYKLNEPTWDVLFDHIKEDSYVIDVGANIGFLSMQFARMCSKGKVFSFEPDSQNFENLKRNIQLNNFNNIKIFKDALGAKTETVTLYKIFVNNPGANRILFTKPDTPHQDESIDVAVLDEIAENFNIPRVDVMKIDVEGFEIFALQGAKKIIAKWRPVLFVELAEVNLRQHGYTALSLVEFIEQLGYEVKDARTMREVDKLKTDYHTDIICFPKSKAVH
jgi:FkbM family methyltransferase